LAEFVDYTPNICKQLVLLHIRQLHSFQVTVQQHRSAAFQALNCKRQCRFLGYNYWTYDIGPKDGHDGRLRCSIPVVYDDTIFYRAHSDNLNQPKFKTPIRDMSKQSCNFLRLKNKHDRGDKESKAKQLSDNQCSYSTTQSILALRSCQVRWSRRRLQDFNVFRQGSTEEHVAEVAA